MKTIFRIALAAAVVATMAGCKAFRTLTDSRLKTAQGAPYELIVVCPQQEWTGEVGDTLRAIFTAPIPYLNQTEPLFDVLRVTERGFTGMVADHRNILKVLKDPTLTESSVAVQYDVTSEPQIVMTLMGPSDKSITAFLSANRGNIVLALENAERDRAIKYAEKFNEKGIHDAILKNFGVEMNVPKGYALAANEPDFLWARYEYPTASQGFFIYSYPYEGKESLSPGALLAARNKFAARIPGPSDGSYMTTSDAFAPDFRMFRMVDIYVPIYSKYLTLADLRELNALYATPVMRKAVGATPAIMQEGMSAGAALGQEIMTELQRELQAGGYE